MGKYTKHSTDDPAIAPTGDKANRTKTDAKLSRASVVAVTKGSNAYLTCEVTHRQGYTVRFCFVSQAFILTFTGELAAGRHSTDS